MWWEGSKRVLKVEDDVDIDDPREGFGVTPAVMSTAGAMMVVGRVKELYGGNYERSWIGSFDETWWSEYTMYRLTLNFYGVFER